MNYITKTPFMELYEKLSDLNSSTVLPDTSGIYCIIFDTLDEENNTVQKKYVGQAVSIKRRIKDHKVAAKPGGRDYLVYHAMRKHPYKIEVLELCPVDKLNEREIFWIKELHTQVNDPQANGYNLNQGGGGDAVYTKEIISELIELYEANSYNHTKTVSDFLKLHKNDARINKLCTDTLRIIVEANNLPWYNEKKKVTVIYAQTTIPDKLNDKKLRYVPNTSNTKYRKVCESQEEADLLVKVISTRLQADLGDILNSIKQKYYNGKKGTAQAWCLQYLIDNKLYDKYLDLTQYDLSKIVDKSSEVRPRGRKDDDFVIHDSCWGALISYFNVTSDFKVD